MRIYENQCKWLKINEQIVQIYKIRWKSSEDKKPARNRSKVSTGAEVRPLPMVDPCSEIAENLWKSREINEKLWKSIKYDESLLRTRSQQKVSLGAAARPLPMKDPCAEIMKISENRWKAMKIYVMRWNSSEDKKPALTRAKVSIEAAGWTVTM